MIYPSILSKLESTGVLEFIEFYEILRNSAYCIFTIQFIRNLDRKFEDKISTFTRTDFRPAKTDDRPCPVEVDSRHLENFGEVASRGKESRNE